MRVLDIVVIIPHQSQIKRVGAILMLIIIIAVPLTFLVGLIFWHSSSSGPPGGNQVDGTLTNTDKRYGPLGRVALEDVAEG